MWQISMKPASILLIFGTNHESGSQIPCAKYKHSVVNGQPVIGHHTFSTGLPLQATFIRTLKSLLFNLKNCLKGVFT